MFTSQRAAQLGLGAVSVVLVLCMGVLIANGMNAAPMQMKASTVTGLDLPTASAESVASTSPASR